MYSQLVALGNEKCATGLEKKTSADPFALESIEKAQSGDQEAMHLLFTELYKVIHKQVVYLCGFGPWTDDVVQESMLQIFYAFPKFKGNSKITTWAVAITKRVLWKQRRKRKKLAAMVELDDSYRSTSAGHHDQRLSLISALQELSTEQREAFVLVEVMDLTANEASQLIKINENTLASRVRRARQKLARLLEGDNG